MGRESGPSAFVVVLTVLEGFAFVGVGTALPPVGESITALDVLFGLAAVLTVLATGKLAGRRSSRRRAGSRRAADPSPGVVIPLEELASRIGARVPARPAVAEPPQEPAAIAPLAATSTQTNRSVDPLTGLFGLPALAAGAATSLELEGHKCAVIVFDVDRFTGLSEHGNLPDELGTQLVATALWSNLRQEDLAARFGGDRFVVFLDGCDRVAAERVVARVKKSVVSLCAAVGRKVSLSAGIAASSGGTDLYGLIAQADPQRQGRRAGGWRLSRPA